MNRPIRWYDYLTINIYFFGLTALSQTNGLVLPLLVQQFVGEGQKGTYYGVIRLWTLMVALLAQAVWGLLSDRSMLRWGRRRPYIFAGTLVNLVFIAMIAFSAGLNGFSGFWILFVIVIFQQFASNAGQAAQQGLIPDLVPESKRGAFSGIKAVLEVPLPLIIIAFTVAKIISAGHLVWGIALGAGILAVSMLIALWVPEKPQEETPPPFTWQPILRLALMTAVFTGIILGMGWCVQLLGRLAGSWTQATLMWAMGAAGLFAMLVAVGLGVWASVYLSVGQQAVRRNPSFTWWVVNRLAFLVGAINLSTFAIYFIQARLGLVREKAAGPASLLMTVVGVFILLTALPSGWLADRFGRKLLVAISGVVGALGVAIALTLPNINIIYVGGCLIGVATGLFYAANWALGTSLVPKDEAGRYLGISNLAGAGAGAVGAYIGGPVADYISNHVTDTQGSGYVVLFAIFGLMFLLSVVALLFVKEPAASKALQPTSAASQAQTV